MHLLLIPAGVVATIIVLWLLLRGKPNDSVETNKTVLSSDTYTKVVLTITAISTSLLVIQELLN